MFGQQAHTTTFADCKVGHFDMSMCVGLSEVTREKKNSLADGQQWKAIKFIKEKKKIMMILKVLYVIVQVINIWLVHF